MSSVEPASPEVRQRISLPDNAQSVSLFGQHDKHLRLIEEAFPVRIVARSNEVEIIGQAAQVALTQKVFEQLQEITRKGHRVEAQQVRYIIGIVKEGQQAQVGQWLDDQVIITHRKKVIRPKNIGQKKYIDAIRRKDIVFGIGPAGTGKTYLAMAAALRALSRDIVSRVILTRPAVEAGESLGFLPGDMLEKVNPYLRPLYDALHDMIDMDRVQRYMERDIIEVAPLAFMRGRTLNDSFIILDEAQNTTPEQMKMFLTRLGNDSKTIITGDITQIDLPSGKKSGLVEAAKILKGIKGIEIVHFSKSDVVRHPLVQEIIDAYEKYMPEKESTRDDLEEGSEPSKRGN